MMTVAAAAAQAVPDDKADNGGTTTLISFHSQPRVSLNSEQSNSSQNKPHSQTELIPKLTKSAVLPQPPPQQEPPSLKLNSSLLFTMAQLNNQIKISNLTNPQTPRSNGNGKWKTMGEKTKRKTTKK
ncbi:hypothetical protein V6N11_022034 [Hibiscus sabdariffa]|uniref:Uncharacterized protein n=1 Tax=Hibiscus sabdariffa TaxID=183260 RepID=A0ABR2TIB1_9ROSI